MNKVHRLRNEEQGFTLIELLVVIVIIGILASVAIPIYMNQQKTAVDSATTSDVRNVATNVETLRVMEPVAETFSITEPTNGTALLNVGPRSVEVAVSDGTQLAVTNGDERGTYIICGWNEAGKSYATEALVWDSSAGGLQKNTSPTDNCGPVAPPAPGAGGDGTGGDGTETEGGSGTEGDGTGGGTGNDSASGVEETEAPNAPSNAVVLSQRGGASSLTAYPSNASYTVTWEAPDGPGVDEYVVQVYRSSHNDPMNTSTDVLLGSKTISGNETTTIVDATFNPSTSYVRAVVVASNEAGESERGIGQRIVSTYIGGGLKGSPRPTYPRTHLRVIDVSAPNSFGVTLTCLDGNSNQVGESVYTLSRNRDTASITVPCMTAPGVTQIRADVRTYSDNAGTVPSGSIPLTTTYPFS